MQSKQRRTESIQRRPWQPLYGPWVTLEHSTTARWIRLVVDFEEGGNRSAWRKPSKSGWDRLKLNPHTTFAVEVEGVIDVHYASLTSQHTSSTQFIIPCFLLDHQDHTLLFSLSLCSSQWISCGRVENSTNLWNVEGCVEIPSSTYITGLQVISQLAPVKLSSQTYFCSDISQFWPDKHW